MKITYIKTLIIISLIISTISCRAQNLSLNTSLDNIPQNAYLKDTNNDLLPYIGTYKANFEGKEVTLFITKENNKLMDYGDQKFYRDALVVKYIVKNSLGAILQDTQNDISNIEFYSTKVRQAQNAVEFYYSGTNCHVGWGDIYLKKINTTQISWEYRPDDITTTSQSCPGNQDTAIYLPETKNLIFTKQ